MTTRDRAITPKRNEGSSILPAPLGERTYDAQNWVGGEGGRGDMVMLIRPNGQPAESVRYSAFGRPFNIRSNGGADFNGDGVVDLLDLLEFNPIYTADNGQTKVSRADVNLDGTVDLLDLLAFNAAWTPELGNATGRDVLTAGETRAHGGNRKGYAGYEHEPWWTEFTLSGTPPTGVPNAEAGPLMQLARHRFYRADLGTWTRRDPLGYVDGVGLYGYAWFRPLTLLDPNGTCSTCALVADDNLPTAFPPSPPYAPNLPGYWPPTPERPYWRPRPDFTDAYFVCLRSLDFPGIPMPDRECAAQAKRLANSCCHKNFGWDDFDRWNDPGFCGPRPDAGSLCVHQMRDEYQRCVAAKGTRPGPAPTAPGRPAIPPILRPVIAGKSCTEACDAVASFYSHLCTILAPVDMLVPWRGSACGAAVKLAHGTCYGCCIGRETTMPQQWTDCMQDFVNTMSKVLR